MKYLPLILLLAGCVHHYKGNETVPVGVHLDRTDTHLMSAEDRARIIDHKAMVLRTRWER